MKSRDEFKNSIFNKLEQYYIEKHKKRMCLVKVLAPICVCLILAFTILFSPLKDIYKMNIDLNVDSSHSATPTITDKIDDFKTTPPVLYSLVIVKSDLYDGSEQENKREYKKQEKMYAIVKYIENLNFTYASDGIDDNVTNLNITISYSDGKKVNYLLKDNLIKIDDGEWYCISDNELTGLLTLINNMEPD